MSGTVLRPRYARLAALCWPSVKLRVNLLQFLSDRDMLRAFLFTLRTLDAGRGSLFKRHEGIVDHYSGWVLEGDGVVVEGEIGGYVDP